MQISDKDFGYAVDEMVSRDDTPEEDLDWEKEIIDNSRDFYEHLLNRLVVALKTMTTSRSYRDKKKQTISPRSALTCVFAAVYSARGRSLPKLAKARVLDLESKYKNAPRDVLLGQMAKMNPAWAELFNDLTENFQYFPQTELVIFLFSKALLDKLEEDGDVELDKGATSDDDASGSDVSDPVDANEYVDDDDDDGPRSNKFTIVPVSSKSQNYAISFDEIGGLEKVKAELKDLVIALANRDMLKKWGTRPPRGIGLHGPPGNAKTLLARALATEAKVPFYSIDVTDLLSMWWSKSEKKVKRAFTIVKKTGGILFFDEFDALAPSRSGSNAHEASKRVVTTLNRQMDGFIPSDRVIVIITTNRLEDIDKSVLRPGRIDRIIEVPMPDLQDRREIFNVHIMKAEKLSGFTLFHNIDLDLFASKTDGWSGADIAEIVRRVLYAKALEEHRGGEPYQVTTEEIVDAIGRYERVRDIKRKIGFK